MYLLLIELVFYLAGTLASDTGIRRIRCHSTSQNFWCCRYSSFMTARPTQIHCITHDPEARRRGDIQDSIDARLHGLTHTVRHEMLELELHIAHQDMIHVLTCVPLRLVLSESNALGTDRETEAALGSQTKVRRRAKCAACFSQCGNSPASLTGPATLMWPGSRIGMHDEDVKQSLERVGVGDESGRRGVSYDA